MKTLKYLSLFSGVGGFEYGLEQSKYDFECIGFSEIDKYSKSIYIRRFPKHKDLGDATDIRTEELEDFELLVGGFPCQAFSMSGKRKGFDDTRGTLFFEIARICAEKKPRYILVENVKGLLSHDGGRTYKKMLGVLSELGYDVEWQIYNSKEHGGVPQNRERLYIKGYFRAKCGGEILSQKRDCESVNMRLEVSNQINTVGNLSRTGHGGEDVMSDDGVSSTLTACNYKHPLKIIEYNNWDDVEIGKVYATARKFNRSDTDGTYVNTLTQSMGTGGNNVPMLHLKTNTLKGYDEVGEGDGVRLCHPSSTKARGRTQKGQTGAISTSADWGTVDRDYRIRRLTPRECERLQAFPDDWTRYGKDDEIISDTQRYKCLGNAVTTSVVTYIADNMFGGYFEDKET